jgi:hypothetical protein
VAGCDGEIEEGRRGAATAERVGTADTFHGNRDTRGSSGVAISQRFARGHAAMQDLTAISGVGPTAYTNYAATWVVAHSRPDSLEVLGH